MSAHKDKTTETAVANPNNFSDFTISDPDTGATLEWEWIGEGVDGDFNPEDPEDRPHLRANLTVPWRDEVFSYCTLASTDMLRIELEEFAKDLFSNLNPTVSPKRIMERWTWYTRPRLEGE